MSKGLSPKLTVNSPASHQSRTFGEEKERNKQSCKSSDYPAGQCILRNELGCKPFVTDGKVNLEQKSKADSYPLILSRIKTVTTVSKVNRSDAKVSSYPEKALPINKRKSLYDVYQKDGVIMINNEEDGYPERPRKQKVKIRTLKSIYQRTQPLNAD